MVAATAGLSVLVAEDNKVNQDIVRRMLERLGCRVETVDNGLDAVAAVHRSSFDVVLMDVQMPGLDGFAATAAIRALPCAARRDVWIVALTAAAFEEDVRRCRDAGMNDFLAKPVRLADLDACLARLPTAGATPSRR
jgi:two-component system, sensor histidine kinase and response regulator